MDINDIITISPDIQFGTPVFTGSRVPVSVSSLFQHLEKGISIDEFLIDFPSVTKGQCNAAIELAAKLLVQKILSGCMKMLLDENAGRNF